MQKPVFAHRTDEFEEFYGGLLDNLKYLFQTHEGKVATIAASGTGGVESAMYSVFEKGDTVAVVTNGKFSERWEGYGNVLGCKVKVLNLPWGQVPSTEAILDLARGCKGIVLTHCETSTGACLDLEEIALSLRKMFPDILILVDAITTVGAQAFYFDDWGIDCAIVASQKALMAPAGLCAFAVSRRYMQNMRAQALGDYQHLGNYLEFAESGSYPFTPPLIHLFALGAALDYIRAASLPQIWGKTHVAAKAFRKKLIDFGGDYFHDSPANSLTVFSFPETDMIVLKNKCEEQGFILAGGQGQLKGKVLRISHMGLAADTEIVEAFWEAFVQRKD